MVLLYLWESLSVSITFFTSRSGESKVQTQKSSISEIDFIIIINISAQVVKCFSKFWKNEKENKLCQNQNFGK